VSSDRPTVCDVLCFHRQAEPAALEMEAADSTETLETFYQTKRRHLQQDPNVGCHPLRISRVKHYVYRCRVGQAFFVAVGCCLEFLATDNVAVTAHLKVLATPTWDVQHTP